MIYLDTSALVKLVWAEASTAELVTWLGQYEDVPLLSSTLTDIELRRAVWRVDPTAMPDAELILAELIMHPIDPIVVRRAGQLSQPHLRSLDAIHLATATGSLRRGDVQHFVTYDERLLQAATEIGLPALSP